MQAHELRKKYLEFFKSKGHAVIRSASLIPEHDPTVLFTTAGMHPLVPFIVGQPHPLGKRLTNVQKCVRTGDIDLVGDATHLTFFEMLGNWSLGDYFKKEAIHWSFEFLTKELGFDPVQLHVTVFAGDKDAPRDDESASTWMSLGIPQERVYFLPKSDNWWGPAGTSGPCGPCTEMFIDTKKRRCSPECAPGCGCGKFVEIWNDVFMEYNKTAKGAFIKLKQHNVDTGMGVERTSAMLQGKKTVFETELFTPIIAEIGNLAGKEHFSHEELRSVHIIADHIKAATFILGDERGVVPSNLDQGYILRRFIRRSVRHGRILGIHGDLCRPLAKVVIGMYAQHYPELKEHEKKVMDELVKEEEKFRQTLERGLKQFEKVAKQGSISGREAFLLFQSYGFPFEMVRELADDIGITVDELGFNREMEQHQELSRKGAEKKFKGGLSEASAETTRLHTATHLLNEALRKIVSPAIHQRGSNITPERLRFDFNFDRKLTDEEVKKVEAEVNAVIRQGLDVTKQKMKLTDAIASGAEQEFGQKYPDEVWVYSVGDYSKEVCGGPHVTNTKDVGTFKILKEQSVAAGIRRIKAVVE